MRVLERLCTASICLGPIDAPRAARHWRPDKPLLRGAARMVVKHGGALIETASVPRIAEAEFLKIEMMAKLMAEGAQKRAERCDFLAHRCSHPYADQFAVRRVVAKLLCR